MSAAWRRARADLWPLLVTAVVVALLVAVTDAVPRLLTARADTAVRTAVAQADPAADVVVTSRYGAGTSDATAGESDTTIGVDDVARSLDAALPASLGAVLDPPVASAASSDLNLSTAGLPTGGLLRLAYVWAGQEPAVRWRDGVAPGRPGPDLAVQVGLSEAVADALDVGAGDTVSATTADRTVVPLLVTGVFVALDPQDAAWTARPELLGPRAYGREDARTTVVAGLLSAASLPAARAALEPDGVTRTFRLAVDPQALDHAAARDLVRQVAALEASPDVLTVPGSDVRVTSRLDLLLTQVGARVDATWSQAVVVLTGLAAGGALVLLVAGDLLARRRATALRTVRARGTSLAGVAGAAAAESAVVVGAGAAAGLVLGAVVAPGTVTWPGVVGVAAVGVLAPAAFATVTARHVEPRRVPTDRHRRRLAQRVRTVRRVSLEAALLVVAVGATAALVRRGAASLSGAADLLLAAAPVLVAVTGALLLWRGVPPLVGAALGAARRSRKAGPLLAMARARAAGAVLPFVALVVLTTLVALCAALAGTARAGQEDGAWDAVGADVVVRTTSPDTSVEQVAESLARADGVDAVAVARVQDDTQLFGVPRVGTVRVLAVDPLPYGDLLARTPTGPAPQLGALADASDAARAGTGVRALPALVTASLLDADAALRWGDVTIDLQPVGETPALPAPQAEAGVPTVVVDRAALTAVAEALADARENRSGARPAGADRGVADGNTVWAVGPGAPAAAHTAAATVGARDLSRAQWLADRRSDPLTSGLVGLVVLVALVCAALAATVVVLDAAASAPGRARSLASARVLGLRGRAAARVAAGELLPPTLVGAVGGVALGVLLVGVLVGPLALRLVTGQADDPAVAPAWWAAAPVALLALTVLVVVAVESSTRRRERLGQVLRVR
ncbi:hypothetical protein GXP71_06365 [Cellulomonas sp. H30R-01]|uniref:FtsX-like permease family protein n=1 Tax=Cellulomonas sp. H30R-01 TaxID=2704467 RepID=UPI00138B5D97|nr:FtsX-like permease family protein [Cellulomonas sp. H30R-01]QHT55741.1 hypothetical protein GXP71_06365 [Cellulomonas sp. H30R-01]